MFYLQLLITVGHKGNKLEMYIFLLSKDNCEYYCPHPSSEFK